MGDGEAAHGWDARRGKLLVELSGHSAKVRYAAWSPDGSRIVTTSGDRTARVWDATSGIELAVFSETRGQVDYAA